ncbi:hypothetical protein GGI18_002904 [Coemansia linderi]|uniref:Uncharacterized protein n=1 Tax=Coemansia linderi TaxID=2663919 RepID=A0ACC1KDQ7_9FUNG|nr:hypothetical protein GGI18_002904 [Coemansia linderi]
MSMFSSFDKDLKKADGCLHKAADMFFHPIGEDVFHKWDTKHPAFPGPKLTKVTLECKDPPPPPPPPPEPTCWRIYPCFKVIDKCKVEETEWHPMMKDYTAEKVWQLHVYLPDVGKDKVMVDICDGTVVVHGEGIFHTHCGMWPGHVEHCCDCTRKEPTPFVKQFKLPDKCKLKEAFVEFEKEVMVVRILRG